MTTEEGRIPTMQLNSIQPFITVTIAVSRKFEVLSDLDYTYLIENSLVGLYLQSKWNEQCKLLNTCTCRETDQFAIIECN